MKAKKQIVRIREKDLANGNKSLFLDISWNGKRTKEYLRLYLVKPLTLIDRDNNRKTMQLAEQVRAKRQTDLQAKNLGLQEGYSPELNLIEYVKQLSEKRRMSNGNYGNWESMIKHLSGYCDFQTTFLDVDVKFIEGFKSFLQTSAKTKSNLNLSRNSQISYFNKFKAAIKQAFEDRIIPENPAQRVKSLKPEDVNRQYLTIEELRMLAKTECRYDVLKRAFLFSCLTGMRWSDINKLTWSEVHQQGDNWRIHFRQKKTGGQEYLDINQEARVLLGDEPSSTKRVFEGLKYSHWYNLELQRWIMRAGINKEITFHCGRHTFAIMLLEIGTDIYTVSKLLGHLELKTTQVYAKVLDQKKMEAVNKLPSLNL